MSTDEQAQDTVDDIMVPLVAMTAVKELLRKASQKLPDEQKDNMYAMAYSYLTVGEFAHSASILDFLAMTGNSSRRVDLARAFIAFENAQFLISAMLYYNAYQYDPSDFETYKASLLAYRQYIVTDGQPLDALDNWVALSDESVREAAAEEVRLLKATSSSG